MEVTAAAASYLRDLTARVVSVFERRLTGMWLLGSGAYGGFGDGSDLDVQAATENAPTTDELEALVGLIVPDLGTCPAAGLEFVLYDRAVLETPAPPLRWSLNLNGGPSRSIKVSTDSASESWHWFVLDLAIGLDFSVTLQGAALVDVVGAISRELQLAAIRESLAWHQEHEPHGVNHLGNAVRGLRYVEAGTWGSKRLLSPGCPTLGGPSSRLWITFEPGSKWTEIDEKPQLTGIVPSEIVGQLHPLPDNTIIRAELVVRAYPAAKKPNGEASTWVTQPTSPGPWARCQPVASSDHQTGNPRAPLSPASHPTSTNRPSSAAPSVTVTAPKTSGSISNLPHPSTGSGNEATVVEVVVVTGEADVVVVEAATALVVDELVEGDSDVTDVASLQEATTTAKTNTIATRGRMVQLLTMHPRFPR